MHTAISVKLCTVYTALRYSCQPGTPTRTAAKPRAIPSEHPAKWTVRAVQWTERTNRWPTWSATFTDPRWSQPTDSVCVPAASHDDNGYRWRAILLHFSTEADATLCAANRRRDYHCVDTRTGGTHVRARAFPPTISQGTNNRLPATPTDTVATSPDDMGGGGPPADSTTAARPSKPTTADPGASPAPAGSATI